MPYQWVEAESMLKYKDVTVYFVYRNDFMNEGAREYWYGYTPDCSDDGDNTFDIRDVASLVELNAITVDHLEILMTLIDAGILTSNGIVKKEQ